MQKNNKDWKVELKKFHTWLSTDDDYLAMLSHGSIATGDPWISGLSDYDIIIIYKKNPLENFSKAKIYLEGAKFSDYFHFHPLTQEQLNGQGTDTFSFSIKFRTKVLFGKDVLKDLKMPDREPALQFYHKAIEKELNHLQLFIINSHKSASKIRKEFWRKFKHIFMLLAIKAYGETGHYPRTRKEIVKRLKAPELKQTWEVLHDINHKSKGEILKTATNLLEYLKKP